MQKTRLNLDTCHRLGDHWIDVATEVGIEAFALLVVVFVLIGRVMNGKVQLRSKTVLLYERKRAVARARVQGNDEFAILI